MKKLIQLLVVSGMGMSMAACSGGLEASSGGVQSGLKTDIGDDNNNSQNNDSVDVDTKVAEEAALEAEAALVDAEEAISELMDNKGNLKIFSSDDSEVSAQFVVSDKLEDVLGKALEKLKVIPQTFDKARGKLTAVMAKLDPTNAAHQLAIDKIMLAMGKLDEAQDRVRLMTSLLADKIDLVLEKIDVLSEKLKGNVLTALLLIEVNQVKAVILDFKAAVKAL